MAKQQVMVHPLTGEELVMSMREDVHEFGVRFVVTKDGHDLGAKYDPDKNMEFFNGIAMIAQMYGLDAVIMTGMWEEGAFSTKVWEADKHRRVYFTWPLMFCQTEEEAVEIVRASWRDKEKRIKEAEQKALEQGASDGETEKAGSDDSAE